MRELASFLEGRWVEGTGEGRVVRDSRTSDAVARVRSEGLDVASAMAWTRRVGGAALRAATFEERGEWLIALGKCTHKNRDELLQLSTHGGATRSDGKFDVDGASGTLIYYGRLARSLGARNLLMDGEQEPILGSRRFVSQHIRVPRQGLALHVNAFNFPAWGMAEKLAVAILAGVPVLTKPAPVNAIVAHRLVERWLEEGVLPEGALSLLHGEPADLLDHVQGQDCIAFTGSAATGRWFASHPTVVATGARVSVEADSVNAAVVGPDVQMGSETYDMLVNHIVREITQKAGQKCTAIRRVLVTPDLLDDLAERLVERLELEPVGDPNEKTTRVGPLVDAAQRRHAEDGIAALLEEAEVLWKGVAPDEGCFVAPHLLKSSEGARVVHGREVFAPVVSLVPYDGDSDTALELVRAGEGGLLCVVYSDDAAWAGRVVLGASPWHGRVFWGSKKVADQAATPGMVLPDLVHGGPGRAGGGEELGGIRGLAFYMQRTVIQADRGMLGKLLGG